MYYYKEELINQIVPDQPDSAAAKVLKETLGVQWGKLFPVPNYNINKYPESKKYIDMGYHNSTFNFRLDPTRIAEIIHGTSPSRNNGELTVTNPPAGFPVPLMPAMPNEHSPGLSDMQN